MSKKLIVFIDSGDTLVNEGTEYRNEGSPIVQSCELIDGAKEMLLTLKERGYTIELVADGYTQSFDNSYGQHGLKNIFDARTISEEVGEKKPSQAMFETAMKLLHLTDEDKKRIIMVGNNWREILWGQIVLELLRYLSSGVRGIRWSRKMRKKCRIISSTNHWNCWIWWKNWRQN